MSGEITLIDCKIAINRKYIFAYLKNWIIKARNQKLYNVNLDVFIKFVGNWIFLIGCLKFNLNERGFDICFGRLWYHFNFIIFCYSVCISLILNNYLLGLIILQ